MGLVDPRVESGRAGLGCIAIFFTKIGGSGRVQFLEYGGSGPAKIFFINAQFYMGRLGSGQEKCTLRNSDA